MSLSKGAASLITWTRGGGWGGDLGGAHTVHFVTILLNLAGRDPNLLQSWLVSFFGHYVDGLGGEYVQLLEGLGCWWFNI